MPLHVTLVRPPSVSQLHKLDTDVSATGAPPLGLAYIAAVLDRAGYEVAAVDAVGDALDQHSTPFPDLPLIVNGMDIEQIVQRIPAHTGCIGVSCMFASEWIYCKQVVNRIAAAFPGIPLILGGEQGSSDAEYILRSCPGVMACVRGEGEDIFLDLLDALTEGRSLEEVDGLVLRRADGTIHFTTAAKRKRHLDEYPWPKWDIFPIEKYLDQGGGFGSIRDRTMPMLASRGCPFRCTFCSNPDMWGKLWNVRSPHDVVAEMQHYIKQYHVDHFTFFDLTTIVRKEWIVQFANLVIAANLGVEWSMPSGTRSEAIDAEVVALLKRSGCPKLSFAPESGSQAILDAVQKKVNLEKMLVSMRACAREGITTKAHIIMGFPFETRLDLFKSYWFMIRMALAGVNDCPVYIFHPYPGSAIHKQLRETGILPPDGDEYDRFMALSLYNNYSNVDAWSRNMSGKELRLFALGGMSLFYVCQFLFRPWRLAASMVRLARKRPTTMLERLPEVMIRRLALGADRAK